ncbi:MAG: rod shape-determining protein RodA [Verrucomicrobiota bacterium]
MPTNQILAQLKRMDWVLTVAMLLLMAGGVAFIYSASYRGPGQPMLNYYKMQLVWFGIGLALYIAATVVDYRIICHWSAVWYIAAVGALLVVLVAGAKVSGARRWLGWHGFGIQPTEVAKLAVLITVAYYLFQRTPELRRRWSTVWGTLGILAVPQLLVFAQPDLGSAAILTLLTFGLMFVAGVRVKHLLILGLLGVLAAPVLWMSMRDYQKSRLTVFLDPDRDPLGAGWNLNQSLIAVGSGGLTGKGYLQGTQNLLGYLPRTVAPNDFLFSVIAEEKGFTGSVCVLGLFAVILFSGLRIAAHARDRLGMLLATGVVVLLFFHVFINIGMTIGLLPVKGLPLPLLSYGGSFVLATMTALGLLQNVWIHRRV